MKPLALALAVALAAACGSSSPKPAPAPRPADAPRYDQAELAEIADGLYDVLDTLAATVEGHPTDCPAMARDLTELFDKSAPIFARAREVAADKQAAGALDVEMKKHDAQAPGLVDRIGKGLAPCANDPAVQAAMEKMPVF